MAERIDALVTADMSAEEAAEVIGCPLDALVQHGNGYAVCNPVAPAPKRKAAKVAAPAPEADEQEGE